MNKLHSYYIAETDCWAKRPILVKVITDGKQIFVWMKKDSLGYPMPAWAPLPYQWFKGSSYRKWENKGSSRSIVTNVTNSIVK